MGLYDCLECAHKKEKDTCESCESVTDYALDGKSDYARPYWEPNEQWIKEYNRNINF